MAEHILPALTLILVLGVTAQWIAWRVGLPSILLLLSFGIVAGPIAGWLSPDDVFGDLLLPLVSISVALILFEGGLTLKMSELPKVGSVVRNLVTLGAVATWLISTLAAYWILGLSASLSALLGAVLIVTGPTVIGPLLRLIRPSGLVGPMLRWEGIVIDPIGALLTVLVFEITSVGADPSHASAHIVWAVGKTIVVGGGLGLVGAIVLTLVLERYWIADRLQNALSLMLVVGSFAGANAIQHEAGLLAVTVMGFAMANQKRAPIEHIVEFKENLQVLLLSALFVVLAARIDIDALRAVLVPGLMFVAVLIFVARPLSVFLSTAGSSLNFKQKLFLSWMAPRGIVAAAVASIFALKLEHLQAETPRPEFEAADQLVPITFITIIATVAVYGLTAPFLARRLGVAEASPQGVLFAGAHKWARQIAAKLVELDLRVLLVDTNRRHTQAARMEGLPTYNGSILAEQTLDELDLGGVGRLVAVTPNDGINVLAVHRFERILGRAACYQLSPQKNESGTEQAPYLHGRWLFGENVSFWDLEWRCTAGFIVKVTKFTDEFGPDEFLARYGQDALLLFVVGKDNQLRIMTCADASLTPEPGESVVAYVREPAL